MYAINTHTYYITPEKIISTYIPMENMHVCVHICVYTYIYIYIYIYIHRYRYIGLGFRVYRVIGFIGFRV